MGTNQIGGKRTLKSLVKFTLLTDSANLLIKLKYLCQRSRTSIKLRFPLTQIHDDSELQSHLFCAQRATLSQMKSVDKTTRIYSLFSHSFTNTRTNTPQIVHEIHFYSSMVQCKRKKQIDFSLSFFKLL